MFKKICAHKRQLDNSLTIFQLPCNETCIITVPIYKCLLWRERENANFYLVHGSISSNQAHTELSSSAERKFSLCWIRSLHFSNVKKKTHIFSFFYFDNISGIFFKFMVDLSVIIANKSTKWDRFKRKISFSLISTIIF